VNFIANIVFYIYLVLLRISCPFYLVPRILFSCCHEFNVRATMNSMFVIRRILVSGYGEYHFRDMVNYIIFVMRRILFSRYGEFYFPGMVIRRIIFSWYGEFCFRDTTNYIFLVWRILFS